MITDIQEFLAQNILAEASKITYRHVLERFGAWLDRVGLSFEAVKPVDILRYVKEQGLSSGSSYQMVTTIRIYARWKYGENHPATKVRYKRIDSGPQRTLTAQQAVHLLNTATGPTETDIRNTAIVALLLDTGLRESEICRLRLDDTNLQDKSLKVLCKGGKWGDAVFSQKTAWAVEKWLAVREKIVKPGVGTLFISINSISRGSTLTPKGIGTIFKSLSKKAGFKVSPHDMRRTFACILISNGAPTELIRRAGRWSSISMVQIYTRRAQISSMRKYLPLQNRSGLNKDQSANPPAEDHWKNEYQ